MARFSEEELDEIRRNTDIVTLIESYGTKLKERPTPNEYLGCCPLHEDETPSLFVNRAKGKWQCKGCGAEGDCLRGSKKRKRSRSLMRSNFSKPRRLASWLETEPKPHSREDLITQLQ